MVRHTLAAVSLLLLSGCTVFIPKAAEPSEGPRARVRVVGGPGDLIVTPGKQPDGKHGGFVAHGLLYPGTRHKLGMPDRDDPVRWADEYYLIGDQDVQVYFSFEMNSPGDKYSAGHFDKCGPIDGQFHAQEGMDYEVSAMVGPSGCAIHVTWIVSKDGHAVAFLPMPILPCRFH